MSKKKKERRGPNGQKLPRLRPGMGALVRRARASGDRIRLHPSGQEKMSEILLQFAAPIMPPDADAEMKRAVLTFACSVWNSCLMPNGRDVFFSSLAREGQPLAEEDAALYSRQYEALAARKAELFPENRRFVFDLEVTDRGSYVHVNVASSLLPEDAFPAEDADATSPAN